MTRYIEEELSKNSWRGRGRGQWGEGFSGTSVQDTWTKQSGSVDAREELGLASVGGRCGEKMQTSVIEQQQNNSKNVWYNKKENIEEPQSSYISEENVK